MAISSDLEQLLSSWLPRQGWFPKLETELGADPDITPMSVTQLFEFDTDAVAGRHTSGSAAGMPDADPAGGVEAAAHAGTDRSDAGTGTGRAGGGRADTETEHYRIIDNRTPPPAPQSPDPTPEADAPADSGALRAFGTVQGHQAIISVGDGRTLRRLNIPLSFRTQEDYALRPHLIGTVDDITLGRCYVYDGSADPVFVLAYAQAMAAGRRFQGGQVQANRVGEHDHPFARLDDPATLLAHSEVIRLGLLDSRTNESSVVIDDPADPCVLTFFRVIRPGLSSAVRIPVALTEAESDAVPEVIGWAAGRWFDATDLDTQSAPLAILSRTERESQPAWREAIDIACTVDSGSLGSYNKRAMALGTRVGELHLDLAAEFGVVRSTGEPTADWVKKWQERVDWALARAPLALSALGTRLRAHRDALGELTTLGGLQRIHGELTLNQVVTSPVTGFRVVNFSEDTQEFPKPPAIDLVALLRSVDYAAGYARLRRTGALELDAQPVVLGFSGLEESGESMQEVVDSPEYLWSSQAQNSLLTGYSHAVNASVGLHDPVLRAVLVDRLLVEVVTELRNRPTWLIVPLATLTLLLGGRLEHDVPTADEEAAARAWIAPASVAEVSAEQFSQASVDQGPVIPPEEDRAREQAPAPVAAESQGETFDSTAPEAPANPAPAEQEPVAPAGGVTADAEPIRAPLPVPASAPADDSVGEADPAPAPTPESGPTVDSAPTTESGPTAESGPVSEPAGASAAVPVPAESAPSAFEGLTPDPDDPDDELDQEVGGPPAPPRPDTDPTADAAPPMPARPPAPPRFGFDR